MDYDGRPLVRHQVEVGSDHPAWAAPSVGGDARCTGSVLVVDPGWIGGPPGPTVLADGDGTAAVLPLAGPAVHVVALAPDARCLRRLLEAGQSVVFVA